MIKTHPVRWHNRSLNYKQFSTNTRISKQYICWYKLSHTALYSPLPLLSKGTCLQGGPEGLKGHLYTAPPLCTPR